MTHRRRLQGGLLVLVVALAVGACGTNDDDAGRDKTTFCAKLQEFNSGTQAFDLNVADPHEVEQISQLLDEIEASAPDDIKDDIEARFAYVDDVIAASQGDQDAAQRLGQAQPTDEAQARIDAYAQDQCGIVLEPPSSTPPTTAAEGAVVPPPSAPTTVPATTVPVTPTTLAGEAAVTTLPPD